MKPGEPLITKITEEKQEAGHYKAFLGKPKHTAGPLTERKAKLHTGTVHYTVQSSLSPSGPYTTLLQDMAGTKLVFTGLTVGVKNYIVIFGTNTKGKGPLSKPFPFTPQ